MKVQDYSGPTPQRGEVLVNIKANGINFAELMCRQGLYQRLPKLPAVLGLEGAGEVIQLGEDVRSLKVTLLLLLSVFRFTYIYKNNLTYVLGNRLPTLQVGDRVMCMKDFGLWTEFATVPEDNCFVIPGNMSHEEAAAIPVNYITAYHMLFELGNLKKGKSVLIHMAAG